MSRPPSKSWHPPLDPDDVALWEDVKKSVNRLSKAAAKKEKLVVAKTRKEKAPPAPQKPEKKPLPKTPPPRAASSPQVFDRLALRKIKSGRTEIDDTLDLHGMRQEAAHRALTGFIANARQRGCRLVLVITGKGGRFSKSEGVLRTQLPRWLEETELRRSISGFSKAAIPHGGEGAFYIRLRKRS